MEIRKQQHESRNEFPKITDNLSIQEADFISISIPSVIISAFL